MKPEVSIIAPVYNTEKFLSKFMDSVIGQTFRQWELILVNDCSPDGCHKILAAYEKKDSRIKVVDHAVNRGLSQTRFTGLDHAAGKYVVFADSDDWMPRNAIRVMYDRIEEEAADMVTGSMVRVMSRCKLIKSKPTNFNAPENRTESITMPELFDKYYVSFFGVSFLLFSMWGRMYRRTVLDKAPIKPVPFFFGEDLVFNMTLHPYLSKIAFVTDTVYYYRSGGGTSSSASYFLDAAKNLYRLKEEQIRKYDYNVAVPYLKVEIINCFYMHLRNLVLVNGLSYSEVERFVEEELKDGFYKEELFEGIEMSGKAAAMKSKDTAAIVNIVRETVKMDRPRHMLKTVVSKILS